MLNATQLKHEKRLRHSGGNGYVSAVSFFFFLLYKPRPCPLDYYCYCEIGFTTRTLGGKSPVIFYVSLPNYCVIDHLLLQLQLVFQHFPRDKQGPQRKNLIGCWGFDGWETHSSQMGKQYSLSALHLSSSLALSTLLPL